jgi:hypothetical protein
VGNVIPSSRTAVQPLTLHFSQKVVFVWHPSIRARGREPCSWADHPLGGGRSLPARERRHSNVLPAGTGWLGPPQLIAETGIYRQCYSLGEQSRGDSSSERAWWHQVGHLRQPTQPCPGEMTNGCAPRATPSGRNPLYRKAFNCIYIFGQEPFCPAKSSTG